MGSIQDTIKAALGKIHTVGIEEIQEVEEDLCSSQGNSQASQEKRTTSKIEMLSGLLNSKQKKGEADKMRKTFQATTLEISKDPEMNLFKLSSGNELSGSQIKNEKESPGSGTEREGGRHIKLGQNDYLNKLFNDIKRSQMVNSEKQVRAGKEGVFNDTFGQGPCEKSSNKENEIQKGGESENVFKKIVGSENKRKEAKKPGSLKILGNSKMPEKVSVSSKRENQKSSSRRPVLSTERRPKRKTSKMSLKRKKSVSKAGDVRREKMTT